MAHCAASHAQHTIPESIKEQVETAFGYYPELADTRIEFRFKKNIGKSTMQARPTFWSLFKTKKKRRYIVLVSREFKISGKEFKTVSIPADILIGWFGHELGHLMDYRKRSSLDLLWFGIKYVFSDDHIKEVEHTADYFAVWAGMEDYIINTKRFILNRTDIAGSYKDRIQKYYLSPDEITSLVKQRESEGATVEY